MKVVAGILALVGLLIVLQDAFEVMLLPRRVRRELRFMRVYFRSIWGVWSAIATRISSVVQREHMLGLFGPLSMLLLFAAWAAALITAFGTLEWVVQPPTGSPGGGSPFTEQVYMSGVTFFTLGYGDIVPHSAWGRVLSVVEAGTGIGFIAVVIGYLPVLYQFFSRREAHVIQLDGRAGSPPTAATMLSRHAESGGLEQLNVLLREWEVWASELLESHLSYPMLAYYRSQHHNQSWLSALGCVMDACALVLVGALGASRLQARMTFTMARQVLVEMSQSFGIAPTPFDGGDRLPDEEYVRMVASFADAELEWDDGPEVQGTLAALRATYEPLMDGLARYLLLDVPSWLPGEGAVDHWERGHRGMIARRLIDELGERGARQATEDTSGKRLWRQRRKRVRDS